MELGLYVQHGGECGVRHRAEYIVDDVQYQEVQEGRADVDGVAEHDYCVDHAGYELGVVRLPALGEDGGCA